MNILYYSLAINFKRLLTVHLTLCCLVVIGFQAGLFLSTAFAADKIQSVAGSWRFILGGPQLVDHPFNLPDLNFADSINLPGTTDTNQQGNSSSDRSTGSFTQPYAFTGTCRYQQDVNIPSAWQNRRLTLFLERTKYTQVWLDVKPIGETLSWGM